jgi:hypothetical protein
MNPRARRLRRQRRKPWVVMCTRAHPSGVQGVYEARARRQHVNELRGIYLENRANVIVEGYFEAALVHAGRYEQRFGFCRETWEELRRARP